MSEHYLTLEPASNALQRVGYTHAVYEHGENEPTSVLAGYPTRIYRGAYKSLAEAQAVFPEAQVVDSSTRNDPVLPHTAPSWFDPLNAGEVWDDADY